MIVNLYNGYQQLRRRGLASVTRCCRKGLSSNRRTDFAVIGQSSSREYILSCLIIGRNRNVSAAAACLLTQNMKAELVNTTFEFSGHKKVTADIDTRVELREHYSSHGLLTVKSSSSHWKIGPNKGNWIKMWVFLMQNHPSFLILHDLWFRYSKSVSGHYLF